MLRKEHKAEVRQPWCEAALSYLSSVALVLLLNLSGIPFSQLKNVPADDSTWLALRLCPPAFYHHDPVSAGFYWFLYALAHIAVCLDDYYIYTHMSCS